VLLVVTQVAQEEAEQEDCSHLQVNHSRQAQHTPASWEQEGHRLLVILQAEMESKVTIRDLDH